MKRRLSILLVMSLVLISVMTACFMGCTKAPKALKGVDVKDGQEVVDAIEDFIADGNYTAEIYMNGLIDGTIAISDEACRFDMKYDGEKMEMAAEKHGKGVREYIRHDGKWYYADDEDAKISDLTGEFDHAFDFFIDTLSELDFEYNKKRKVIEGEGKVNGSKIKATIEVNEEGIFIKMGDSEATARLNFTEIGTTEPEMPEGAKPVEDAL